MGDEAKEKSGSKSGSTVLRVGLAAVSGLAVAMAMKRQGGASLGKAALVGCASGTAVITHQGLGLIQSSEGKTVKPLPEPVPRAAEDEAEGSEDIDDDGPPSIASSSISFPDSEEGDEYPEGVPLAEIPSAIMNSDATVPQLPLHSSKRLEEVIEAEDDGADELTQLQDMEGMSRVDVIEDEMVEIRRLRGDVKLDKERALAKEAKRRVREEERAAVVDDERRTRVRVVEEEGTAWEDLARAMCKGAEMAQRKEAARLASVSPSRQSRHSCEYSPRGRRGRSPTPAGQGSSSRDITARYPTPQKLAKRADTPTSLSMRALPGYTSPFRRNSSAGLGASPTVRYLGTPTQSPHPASPPPGTLRLSRHTPPVSPFAPPSRPSPQLTLSPRPLGSPVRRIPTRSPTPQASHASPRRSTPPRSPVWRSSPRTPSPASPLRNGQSVLSLLQSPPHADVFISPTVHSLSPSAVRKKPIATRETL